MFGTVRRMAGAVLLLLAIALFGFLASAGSASASGSKPPGNNGTIKINDTELDPADGSGHNNEPHVACDFTVSFFGYDEGTQTAQLDFTAQPPSGQFQPVATTTGRSPLTFGGHGAGNTLDAKELYRLDVSGLKANPQQGFHIKLTVHVTGSQGADVKHKVFWYQPCETSTPTPTETKTPKPTVTTTTAVPTVTTTTATATAVVTKTATSTATATATKTKHATQTSTATKTVTTTAPVPATAVPAGLDQPSGTPGGSKLLGYVLAGLLAIAGVSLLVSRLPRGKYQSGS